MPIRATRTPTRRRPRPGATIWLRRCRRKGFDEPNRKFAEHYGRQRVSQIFHLRWVLTAALLAGCGISGCANDGNLLLLLPKEAPHSDTDPAAGSLRLRADQGDSSAQLKLDQLYGPEELAVLPPPGRKVVQLENLGGIFVVPVAINGIITLKFIVDSGAADVSIPADVVMTLMRTGTVTTDDFLEKKTYVLADGSQIPSQTFRIRSLKVGPVVIENVTASVTNARADLLLGQSFLSRLNSWSLDNQRHALIIE